MTLLIILHALVAVTAPALGRVLGRRVFAWIAIAPLATLVWLAPELGHLLDGGEVTETTTWVAGLQLELALRLDAFGALMVLLVSGIGTLVFAYAGYYFHERADLGRFAMLLCAFSGAMLGLVLADNILALFVFWELTSVTSYLLIGFEDLRESSRKAALQALMITGIGGLALLAGLVLVGQQAGTWSLAEILADPPTEGAVVSWAVVLILAGAFTKSAQVPFHMWLPGAMEAPTPVSAYLHSATMVKAGVYLVARFSPAFADVGLWRPLTAAVGVATMAWGGYRALRQHDLKLVLAFGTISQLGFLIALFGWGSSKLLFAGTAMLLAHAVFKASLFMVVGIVDHQAHSRDLRRLSGLGQRLPGVFVVASIGALSMAGIPPLLGFVSKEAGFVGFVDAPGLWSGVVLGGLVVGSVLTVAYTLRFVWGTFATKPEVADPIGADVARPNPWFVVPAALLAVVSVAGGLFTALADRLVRPAATALSVGAGEYHLHLWPGLGAPLVLSAVAVGGGLVLFLGRDAITALQDRLARGGGADQAFHAGYAGMLRTAARITRFVQPGSQMVYVSLIIVSFTVLPAVVLVGHLAMPDDTVIAESPFQVLVTAVVIAGALATVLTRRRFAAVVTLGIVGYGVGMLFVVQGAPDLALTQVLIETVVLVLFLLVLRELPKHFWSRRERALKALHVTISVGVAAVVFGLMVTSLAARTEVAVGDEAAELSYPEGEGRNAVNVILADIRAFDTMGELVVIAVAAIGTVALVRAPRPREDAEAPPDESRSGAGLEEAT
ncbi:MAG: hydrogen gas-evolving membrane-bound hydrogenase subunit E [Acidimicrobiales bacterium]